MRSEMIPAL